MQMKKWSANKLIRIIVILFQSIESKNVLKFKIKVIFYQQK